MNDTDLINESVLNYVNGWYEGDAKKMDNALSNFLVKRRVVSSTEIWDINKDWMLQATKEEKGKLTDPKTGIKEITILDKSDSLASVKLLSEEFVDYIHLCKIDGNWRIVNVIWDYYTKK